MLELDSPRWSELSHAYGIASQPCSAPSEWRADSGFYNYTEILDTPTLLKQLEDSVDPAAAPNDFTADPWESLWSALCHQGDVYTASYAAVPHIVRIAFSAKGVPDWQFFGLPASIEIARASGFGPNIPEFLVEPYFAALGGLHDLAHHIARYEWDEMLSRVVAATLVVTKGHLVLGDTIMELSPEAVKEFRVQQGLEADDDEVDN